MRGCEMAKTDFAQRRRDIAQQVRDGLITADEAAQKLGYLAALEAAERRKASK